MRVVNYTEFRNHLRENLNMVNDDGDVVVVSRSKGRHVVMMGLEEYNSIQETLYLTGNRANRKRLDEAISEMKKGKFEKHRLLEK